MFCSISGAAPEDPVVSVKSGHIFERRLIEKYIGEHGKCPITGEVLSADDLLAVHGNAKNVKPRPAEATSIPGLLSTFQNEWDALMLESYTLRRHLTKAREELAHALYQHDAACRVIARLVQERDEAREALHSAEQRMGAAARSVGKSAGSDGAGQDAMEVDGSGADGAQAGNWEQIVDEIKSLSSTLSAQRRKREVSSTLAGADLLQTYEEVDSQSLHKTRPKGVTAVDAHPTMAEVTLSGGVDGDIHIFNRATGKIVASLSGHSKKITAALFHPTEDGVILSASADKTVRVWKSNGNGDYECSVVLKDHNAEVTGLAIHPVGYVVASCSSNGKVCLHDIRNGSLLQKHDVGGKGLHAIAIHPDGLIFSVGDSTGTIGVYEVQTMKDVATFNGHTSKVTSISFSENGYYMASAAGEKSIRVWDLRKPADSNCREIDINAFASAVSFDKSGYYLAVGGGSLVVLGAKKKWAELLRVDDGQSSITSVSFGPDAKFIASSSLDRSVKTYSAK